MKEDMNMTVKQISVFLENKPGQLAKFAGLLRENGIDMRALTLAEAADFGVVRTIVSDPDRAQQVLKEAGKISAVTPVLAIEVPDKPGALTDILQILTDGAINLEYTYAFTSRKNQSAYMVFRVADKNIEKAASLLEAHGINIVKQEDIYEL